MVLLLLFVCWDCFSFGWLVGFMLICIEFEGGLYWLACCSIALLFGGIGGVVLLYLVILLDWL